MIDAFRPAAPTSEDEKDMTKQGHLDFILFMNSQISIKAQTASTTEQITAPTGKNPNPKGIVVAKEIITAL
jgi:hypothetical protein